MGEAKDSILQVCQLTELRQTKEWERYPNRFWGLNEILLQKYVGKHCREWPAGKTELEIKLLIQENSKPQYLIVYTDHSVTKDQSGWGFTVKQGSTTNDEDSAAYTVSASSLTMEVETVTHALRWIASRADSHITHAIILTESISLLHKVQSGMGSPDWKVSMIDIHLRNLQWVYCPGHAVVKGNDRTDRLASKQSSQVACFSEDLKC